REAARLYRLAADQRSPRGQVYLAYMYEHGRGGLARDVNEAIRLYRLAAEQGSAPARSALERLSMSGRERRPGADSEDVEGPPARADGPSLVVAISIRYAGRTATISNVTGSTMTISSS